MIDEETGLCPLGMPEILGENRLAVEIWGDMNTLGWPVVRDLYVLELTPAQRGDLLVKLRVMADEAAAIQRDRIEEQRREAERSR